jgi:hypothetical protein
VYNRYNCFRSTGGVARYAFGSVSAVTDFSSFCGSDAAHKRRQFVGGISMDCDQVFVILTRGPFPTGEIWDEDVETHLEHCADCWRLAEALRPALEVFQEAVPPAESRDLPGYWGDARPAGTVVSELCKPSSRLAIAASARRPARVYAPQRDYSLTNRVSPEVLRAMVLASTLTATVIGLGVLWFVW